VDVDDTCTHASSTSTPTSTSPKQTELRHTRAIYRTLTRTRLRLAVAAFATQLFPHRRVQAMASTTFIWTMGFCIFRLPGQWDSPSLIRRSRPVK
jgi:hypothetical protein